MGFDEIMEGVVLDGVDPIDQFNEATLPLLQLATAALGISAKSLSNLEQMPEYREGPASVAAVASFGAVVLAIAKAMGENLIAVYPNHEDATIVLMAQAMDGGLAEGARLVERVREIGTPTMEQIVNLFLEDE